MVKCPECGALIEVHGRCWACRCCGAEGCGLAGLEVVQSAEAQPRGSADSPRGASPGGVQMPSRVLDCRSWEKP
jgi:hypothetical protein